ncbi:MAG: hypothetical protein ACQCXQ_13010 [Verrucomicrobiales bacterium]|nr:hypothetical protein [Verrucomicrobiota bacterium JB025]
MEILGIVAALGVSFGIGRLLFGWMFDGFDEFMECVRYSLMPDMISLFRGEYFEDMVKSFKLSVFLIGTIGPGVLTFVSLTNYFN